MIIKNTFGMSVVIGTTQARKIDPKKSIFCGSSLDRKESKPTKPSIKKTDKAVSERSMSKRTKSKIRKKIFAFSQLYKRLTFVTFTFVNQVSDEKAILVFRKFLDNMKKRKKGFEYIWVAERQSKNEAFPDNIHFHMITNSYFKAQKTWAYWISLQEKNGIVPRNANFKPSSAFDIRAVSTGNPKRLSMYLTKYLTKNSSSFKCQVWNCSKGVSRLYTDFYSSYDFLDQLYALKGDQIKEMLHEYCTLHFVPIDKETVRFYDVLKERNQNVGDSES